MSIPDRRRSAVIHDFHGVESGCGLNKAQKSHTMCTFNQQCELNKIAHGLCHAKFHNSDLERTSQLMAIASAAEEWYRQLYTWWSTVRACVKNTDAVSPHQLYLQYVIVSSEGLAD